MHGFGAMSVLRTISFALLFQGSSGARMQRGSRQNGTLQEKVIQAQSRGDEDASSLQQADQHEEADDAVGLSRRRGSCHGKRCRRRCDFVLTRPSAEEDSILQKMMTVVRPTEVGKGQDAARRDPHRKHYSKIEFRSAWKVSNTPALKEFRAKVEKLEANKGGKTIPMTTDVGGVKVGNNEYLLWHGGEPEFLDWKVCKSAVTGDGAFGKGIYLADAIDKMDQYAITDHQGAYYQDLLDELNLTDDKLPHDGSGSKPDVVFGLVFRSYMGHHVELQRDNYGDKATSYWRDPVTGKCQTKGGLTAPMQLFFGLGGGRQDGPRKGVASSHEGKFCGRRSRGKKPVWYNEYVLPDTDFGAVEYVVVYDRV